MRMAVHLGLCTLCAVTMALHPAEKATETLRVADEKPLFSCTVDFNQVVGGKLLVGNKTVACLLLLPKLPFAHIPGPYLQPRWSSAPAVVQMAAGSYCEASSAYVRMQLREVCRCPKKHRHDP